MCRFRTFLMVGVLLAGCVCASSANAQGFGGMGGGFGLGFYNYGNNGVLQAQLPYYALFPPVYYSYPVPRPYGYSPFAYPPGTMTPDFGPIQPGAAEDVPAPRTEGTSARIDRTASAPRMYYNQFVKTAATASDTSVAEASMPGESSR